MNWKSRITFCALAACLLAGCSYDREVILFSNQPSPPARPAGNAAPPVKKLSPQELQAVNRAVYGFLLQRHFWDDHEYSAVFLEGDEDEVGALIKDFPNHNPPIKPGDRAFLPSNRTPIDRDTGRPAMVLSVDVSDPVDDTVEAIGKWYAGGAVSGFYTFTLKKSGDDWLIQSSR